MNEKIIKGLTSVEASFLLKKNGDNSQIKVKNQNWHLLLNQFSNPIIYLLFFSVTISFITSDYLNGSILAILVITNSLIGFAQEYQSNRLGEKLNSLVKKETLCLRDENYQFIPSSFLVIGDIIKLKLGDLIPADCEVLESQNLQANESALTGEVENVIKKTSEYLFSGTSISLGSGVCKVTKTGVSTSLGQIANLTLNTNKKSEFNQTMSKLSKGLVMISFIYIISIFGLQLLIGKVEDWQTSLTFLLALVVGIVPEALPIVTSVSLSKQAIKLGKVGLLVKHQTVLEDLGNMDILCTDKTGTLTNNKFKLIKDDYSYRLLQVAKFLSLNNQESFEIAVQEYQTPDATLINPTSQEVIEIPFDPNRRVSGKKILETLYYHGSPKEILEMVNFLELEEKNKILEEINQKEKNGIKCLCYAIKTKGNWEFLGTLYFQDELKLTACQVIQDAKSLNLEIKILTGDSLAIATHIGLQSNLIQKANEAINAEEIDFGQSTSLLFTLLQNYKVIARCTPESKFKIIQILQSKLVVGYLGDGINDAPSLKVAQIGIVVDTSSPIAKETSDIIMTDNDLNNLIIAVTKGRTIFENINKYLKATLSSSFGNFFTMGLLSLVLPFSPMLGIQIIIANLITDIPLISLADDNVNYEDIRKPKHQNLPRLMLICLVLGLVSSSFDFIFIAINKNLPEGQIQTSWFLFSVLTELSILFSIRTKGFFLKGKSPKKNAIICSGIALGVSILISSYLFRYINITTISLTQVFGMMMLALCYFVISELVKLIYYRMNSNQKIVVE